MAFLRSMARSVERVSMAEVVWRRAWRRNSQV
jgi:hypothetical protein